MTYLPPSFLLLFVYFIIFNYHKIYGNVNYISTVEINYFYQGMGLLNEMYKNFINEIVWSYKSPSTFSNKRLSNKHDNLLVYSKSKNYNINVDEIREEYAKSSLRQAERGTIAFGKKAKVDPRGKFPTDVWEISTLNSMAKERVGYDTQKPKKLLEKIVKAFSSEGDVIADFFCGSGTSLVVAKELGRHYIGCDINPRAVEITNKRLNN